MDKWQHMLKKSTIRPDDLARKFDLDAEEVRKVAEEYPIRINPYFLSLIED
jgi:lysine 2,3-aminomutase